MPIPKTKNIVKIPSSMWNTYKKEGNILTLIYYCQIRALYKHPVIYNCNKKKLAEKLGVAYNTLIRHTNYLEEKGILFFKNNNAYIIGKELLQAKYPSNGKTLKIVTGTISQTKKSVNGVPIKSNLRLQEKYLSRVNKKQALTRLSNEYQLKGKDAKWLRKEATRCSYYNYTALTNKRIAELTGNTSASSGRRMKVVLREMGLLYYRRRFEIIPHSQWGLHFDGLYTTGNAFFINGYLVKELPNQFSLNGKYVTYNVEGKKSYSINGLRKLPNGALC